MFWNINSSTKFASFPLDRYRTEISPLNYLQNKYTYALIEISPMSKLGWLLRSSWKHELKLSHNSSDTKGDALRTNVKIIKWNETFSRQRLSQSCLFKSLKIKTKEKENITQQNYKFHPLNISINCFNVISFDIYLKRRQNIAEGQERRNFECMRTLFVFRRYSFLYQFFYSIASLLFISITESGVLVK